MNFIFVTEKNIDILFKMNRQLAHEEGQVDLFTASLEDYSSGFIGKNPAAVGILSLEAEVHVGFCVINYKFATYLGKKVMYIEDLYLKPEYKTEERKKEFLNFLINNGQKSDCARIEMRVMNNFDWGVDLIKNLGFNKIDKWSVYRLSNI